ncbi:MAG: Fe-S cluster assembly sulfur transfer protein SufU [Ferrimicrobium sp.]
MNELEDLYREIILDHYKNPRNQGVLVTPPAVMKEGFNPLCGDEIQIYLQVEEGTLVDIKITGQGCSISRSSASLLSQAVKGRSLTEVEAIVAQFRQMMALHGGSSSEVDPPELDERALGELAALRGVVKFPVRIKCAMLAWSTFEAAISQATSS